MARMMRLNRRRQKVLRLMNQSNRTINPRRVQNRLLCRRPRRASGAGGASERISVGHVIRSDQGAAAAIAVWLQQYMASAKREYFLRDEKHAKLCAYLKRRMQDDNKARGKANRALDKCQQTHALVLHDVGDGEKLYSVIKESQWKPASQVAPFLARVPNYVLAADER
jgi:hypothetical protein